MKLGTGYNAYAAIEELGSFAFATVLDFAVIRLDGALEVDLPA
ncbi:hypothetical protein [Caulobacter sp. NIBR1757]|nr:hypothetical protein [Caulobacter sp. NIBR1757]WGM37708.1 hypothetical protein AMEJIAPC_00608 [Caulobacter sp. NIBR1757]